MSHALEPIGCIRVSPVLNEVEAEFLAVLVASGHTVRGTPTGRGRSDVPFARSAWEVCDDGCCLVWAAGRVPVRSMAESLEFLVDHLFAPGAVGAGHPKLAGFTFDHVLSGAQLVPGHDESLLVEVSGNVVSSRRVPRPCADVEAPEPGRRAAPRSRPWPANVVELRPRQA